MIGQRRVLGLIPSRAGSKRLPGKNVRPIAGRPLVAWSIASALASRYLDRVVVSTDDRETADIATAWGADVPFVRPPDLAQDASSSVDVALHALQVLPERYDLLVLLQPTAPLRLPEDIDDTLARCEAAGQGRCFTVSRACKSPYKMYRLSDDGMATPVLAIPPSFRDQDLPAVHASNGAVYVVDVECLRRSRSFVAEPMPAHEMPKDRSVDVDDEIDFLLADLLLRRRLGELSGRG